MLSLVCVAGCSNIVDYSVTKLNVSSANVTVNKWIENSSKVNGTYLAKMYENDEVLSYYLYLNHKNLIDSVSSIKINIKPNMSDKVTEEKLFRITINDHSPEKIMLDGVTILTSSIPILE